MPLARIEVRKSLPAEEVAAIMEAVYQAQREALKVPEGDRQIQPHSPSISKKQDREGLSSFRTLVEMRS